MMQLIALQHAFVAGYNALVVIVAACLTPFVLAQ
jgi:hypothetical protein